MKSNDVKVVSFKVGKSLVEATKHLKATSVARTRLKTGDCCK